METSNVKNENELLNSAHQNDKIEQVQDIKSATEEKTNSKQNKVLEKKIKPKLFTREDERVEIGVDILFNKDNGEILSILPIDLGLDTASADKILGRERLIFVFSMLTFNKLNRYRERCQVYDDNKRRHVIDEVRMRDFFIIYHLKDWNVTDEQGNKIELTFDENGALSDESLNIVYDLNPTILDVVLTAFERKCLLSGV